MVYLVKIIWRGIIYCKSKHITGITMLQCLYLKQQRRHFRMVFWNFPYMRNNSSRTIFSWRNRFGTLKIFSDNSLVILLLTYVNIKYRTLQLDTPTLVLWSTFSVFDKMRYLILAQNVLISRRNQLWSNITWKKKCWASFKSWY